MSICLSGSRWRSQMRAYSSRRGVAPGLDAGTRALSLFLVNRRPVPEKGPLDEACVFQVSLEVRPEAGLRPRGNPQGLERADGKPVDRHEDDLVADLQFRGALEWAVGHGVSVEPVKEGEAIVVVSNLEIPEPRSSAYLVEKHASDFTNIKTLRQVAMFRELGGAHLAELFDGFSDEEIFEALEAKRAGKTIAKADPSRTVEYKLFVSQPEEKPGDYPKERDTFYARTAPTHDLPAGVGRVVLAHSLREVRVQTGFTRFEARTPDPQGEVPESEDLGLRPAPLATRVRWLPGVEVRGEGFLLQLDEDALRAWQARPEVLARVEDLYAGFLLANWKRPPFPRIYIAPHALDAERRSLIRTASVRFLSRIASTPRSSTRSSGSRGPRRMGCTMW